jgi:hypothetical protein
MTRATSSTRRWVLGLAAVASFMVALDTLVVSTALSTIRVDRFGARPFRVAGALAGLTLPSRRSTLTPVPEGAPA